MTTKERLKIFIKTLKIPVSRFEKQLNVSNGYVNSIQNSIQPDKLSLILDFYPNLNIEWLLLGKGEMLKSGSQPTAHTPQPDERLCEPSADYSASTNKETQLLRQHIAALERTIQDKEEIIRLLKQKL